VSFENKAWSDTAATAAIVSTFQEFRDLFSSEVLAPGLLLGIQRQAFLFTDIAGSTAMYQALGQARAFRLVQDHFGILREVVARHEGAVVKTIGDAVMATFHAPEDAVAAAIEMQRRLQQLEVAPPVDTRRLLKVGVHLGPCVAVTMNERLDYFGTTVNTAARVEHECTGGEVIITGDVHADPEVRRVLAESGLEVATSQVQLRGIRDPVPLYRLRPVALDV
jgi:adenylate cyclase